MTQKQEAINLILYKARALMDEVDVLIENRFYTSAISRAYYGCFHATRALLLTKDLTSKTHSGVIALLHKHFVFENNFQHEKAAFLSKLMQERIDDEYSDFMIKDFSEIEAYIIPAKEYLQYVISYIQSQI